MDAIRLVDRPLDQSTVDGGIVSGQQRCMKLLYALPYILFHKNYALILSFPLRLLSTHLQLHPLFTGHQWMEYMGSTSLIRLHYPRPLFLVTS